MGFSTISYCIQVSFYICMAYAKWDNILELAVTTGFTNSALMSQNLFHARICIFIRILLPRTAFYALLIMGSKHILTSEFNIRILSWVLWADHLDRGERDVGLFHHLLDEVAGHLHGEGLLDRGAQHLHRPPPGLHLPLGAEAGHVLLISPCQKNARKSTRRCASKTV